MFGYYSGVLAAKSGGPPPLLIRPMEIVSERDSAGNVTASTRPWNAEGLAKLMTSRCSLNPSERLIDAAAAVMTELIHVFPTSSAR